MILRRTRERCKEVAQRRTWGSRSFAALVPDHHVAVVVLTNTARSVDRLGLRLVDLLSVDWEP
jgi:hypothetical protein